MSAQKNPRHLIRLGDLEDEFLEDVLDLSTRMKSRQARAELAGRSLGMLFFRRSLRTRASFEAAVHQLGGQVVNFTGMSDLWELEVREGSIMDGRAPEHVKDAAAVLSGYVDALAIRPAPQGSSWTVDRADEGIQTWARHARVPLINMESAMWHPCQALADLLTLREELGEVRGKKLAIVWVHSPVPATASVVHSLLLSTLRRGAHLRLSHPAGYELDDAVMAEAKETAQRSGGRLDTNITREEAVDGAQVVYARSWQSLEFYGNATLAASHRSRLTNWKIDEGLMALGDDARLMHAMPVRRNVEVTDEVLDGPRNLLYRQAENRLHAQKALLVKLLR